MTEHDGIVHLGFKCECTVWAGGELEAALAEEWIKENEKLGGSFLETMLNGSRTERPITLTQRDAQVAATIIQWLGTNCGSSFLNRSLGRVGEYVGRHQNDK